MRNITKNIAGLKRLCELICQANGGHTEDGGGHRTRARGDRNNDLEDFCSDVAMPRGLDSKKGMWSAHTCVSRACPHACAGDFGSRGVEPIEPQ